MIGAGIFFFSSQNANGDSNTDSGTEINSENMLENKNNTIVDNIYFGQANLDSIKFDKESYHLGSSARVTINISYEGEPFYGLILLKMSREDFSGYDGVYLYSNYNKFLIDGYTTINKPIAFSYSDGGITWPSETSIYENEGKHNYEFLLFDCNSIIDEFGKECDEVEFGTDVFDDGWPTSKPIDIKIISIDIARREQSIID